ncbi:MAG: tripartite tricarboxylate transporter substrate binding protein [Rhodovarius sp.]|nr:tripartite tricarboxylate transporter substrate binding protein [Rhodovarius sp.]MDW8314602.1 tripartite tricarboxylate transporter substrate binding protein [Rhodovarius sp.]
MILPRRAVCALPLASPALAQGRFPEKPIRLIVPWTPGGATDIQMRTIAEIAARHLGQPVVVENRPGASGTMGAQHLAREARPDGYTLSQMPLGVFRFAALMRANGQQPPYDPLRDFTWVIRIAGYMGGVVVRPDAPWRSMVELVDHARRHPGSLFYGTPGANTTDVVMRRLARVVGVEWTAVPFRGAAPNLSALLAGNIHFSAETSAWADMVMEGRLRLLAVYTATRAERFPDVPTFRDLGWDVYSDSAYGFAGPRGMEPRVVGILHDAFKAALFDPAHLAVLRRFDMPVRYLDPEAYAASVIEENEREIETVRELNLRPGG